MKLTNNVICMILALASFSSLPVATAAEYTTSKVKSNVKAQADNSSVNKRDTSTTELTADQQKSNSTDVQITADIRKEIMSGSNYSTYAQNIKIITVNGKVTLKGPVRSTAEENSILKSARSVAGASNVVNEIAIVPE